MAPAFFFFNDTATTEIYTLSLHDALPISQSGSGSTRRHGRSGTGRGDHQRQVLHDAVIIERHDGGLFIDPDRSEEHTSELQSLTNLVCRLLLEKKKNKRNTGYTTITNHVE